MDTPLQLGLTRCFGDALPRRCVHCTDGNGISLRQVCVDNLTPVNGADVRLLRSLLAAHTSYSKALEAATFGLDGGDGGDGSSIGRSSSFDTHGFLEEWLVAEETEQTLCRSVCPAASVHLNTALPYDLNVLKVRCNTPLV